MPTPTLEVAEPPRRTVAAESKHSAPPDSRAEPASPAIWKGHAYLLKGVVYSEFLISSNGAKVFEINELKLLDPTATKPEERAVSFLRDRDDANEIDGVMDVRVTPDDGQSWLNPDSEYQKNHQSPAERPMAPMPPAPPSIQP